MFLYQPLSPAIRLYHINVITTNFDSSVTHGDTFPPGKAQGESTYKNLARAIANPVRGLFFISYIYFLVFRTGQLLARFYKNPGYDGYDAKEGRIRKGIIPAVIGNEEGRYDRRQDAANVAPEVHPARYGTGVFAAQGNNRRPAGAHGEAQST
jgi:hypothetical protein